MKTCTIECPHCHHERYVHLTAEGEFYDFEADGQCGDCNKWHDDEPVIEEELLYED